MEGDEEPEKEEKKKMEKDTFEIKIRFNRKLLRWIERSVFIIIILILLVLVFYNPFGNYLCEKGVSEITSVPVVDEPEEEETVDIEVEEEPVVELEPEPEPGEELSGEVVLTIGKIELNEDKTRVDSITVKIDNQKKIFTPLLYVYWYDKGSSEALKSRPKGGKINFTGPIPVGRVTQKKLDDELKAHYLEKDDLNKEFFKIELYDRVDKTLLDTKTKSIATD